MQTLEELARSGMSKAAAARLLGINENKLRRMLPTGIEWAYKGSGRNTDLSKANAVRIAKRRLTDELLQEFARRKKAGEKWVALCAEYGFNESYIRKAMSRRLPQ